MILPPKYIAEFIGSAGLLMVIVGSGIMGESLSPENGAVALLANSMATGAGLFVLIHIFQPISGAHFNPIVTFVEWRSKRVTSRDFFAYGLAQLFGAWVGVLLTHLMFGKDLFQLSTHDRGQMRFLISEAVATFGLLLVILLAGQRSRESVPLAVALYITAAYWCTSSTSFANPVVTIARSLTDTFSGLLWTGVPSFVMAQFVGAVASYWFSRSLIRS
ncbi:MAG: aquaporin [Bdellovibrionales bacterium]